MSDQFKIKSYKGEYTVNFTEDAFGKISEFALNNCFFIIDEKVYNLYAKEFEKIEKIKNLVLIKASENNKNFDVVDKYIDQLLDLGIKRNHKLVAIGGGIIQDITCFISSVLYRGVDWFFFPTTLLAQSDSCIGSKSSINYKTFKNLLGTFTPPSEIYLSTQFQKTLSLDEVRSGIGEIIKVHIIDGIETYKNFIADYSNLSNASVMIKHLKKSLLIKKGIIEVDEFDKNIRNVMNYGHSFGHAIESATNFGIPDGIAVTIGMDIANFLSFKSNLISGALYRELKTGLVKNYEGYGDFEIPFDAFMVALSKDKKNTSDSFGLIVINEEQKVERRFFNRESGQVYEVCKTFFEEEF